MRNAVRLLLSGALVACATAASAQGYIIQTPGQLPTYVNPNLGGGYTVQTPGRLPTYINPNLGGGYTVQTPGQLPTYIRPTTPNFAPFAPFRPWGR